MRFDWSLCSKDFVVSDEIEDHLYWIFDQIKSKRSLSQVLGKEYQYWLSIFWGGNGTGGGPLITVDIAKLLVWHEISMGVSFYAIE